MKFEELMELKRIEQLPHGKAIVEERKGSQNASDIVIYTGYLEPTTSGWLHIYEDSGRAFQSLETELSRLCGINSGKYERLVKTATLV